MTLPLPDFNARHFYPPGGPIEMQFHRDLAGLSAAERKGLRKLGTMPNGRPEVREIRPEVVNGETRLMMTNREVFDYTDARSKWRILLDIRGIKDAISDGAVLYQVGHVTLTMDAYLEFLRGSNPELGHLARIDEKRLETPGIYARWPSGEYLLIDGVHRYIKRFRLGKPTFRVVMLEPHVWQGFMLDLSKTEIYLPDGTVAPYVGIANRVIKARK